MLRLFVVLMLVLCLGSLEVFGCGPGDLSNCPKEYQDIHGDGIYQLADEKGASRRLQAIERELASADLTKYAEKSNVALRGLFKIAVSNLKKRGHYDTAEEVGAGWLRLDGEIERLVRNPNRKITDFEPWSKQLAILYFLIEMKLGYQLCYTLRITDIATFLWTPKVVFNPCEHGESEFFMHFAHDEGGHYRAFLPTTIYWVTSIGCSVATFGAGYFFICSPIAMLVELGADKWLAPKLAPKIYNAACNKGDM